MSEPADRSPRFATTRWTVVLAARDPVSPDSTEALESLCRAYWFPLYAFVRRSGKDPHDAQDLTQAFFGKLLEKEWLLAVSRERGRFRTFLIVAMKRFLSNDRDRTMAEKRGGSRTFVPIDAGLAESRYLAEPVKQSDADHLYERRWALALLERVLARLREDYESGGRAGDFDRLKIFLTAGRGEIPYADIARDLAISEGAARVSVSRMRKRFREIFRQTIADTVSEPGEVDAELRHVAAVLGRV